MKLVILFVALISLSISVAACDHCSSSSVSIDLDALSSSSGNSIGLKNQFGSFVFQNEESSYRSHLINWTFLGSYQPNKKLTVKAFLPLFLNIENQNIIERQVGLGDLALITIYTAFDNQLKNKKTSQQLKFTGGIELPTGTDNIDSDKAIAIPFGSKSVDFLLGGMYVLKVKRYYMSTAVFGKINTTNRSKYHYGHGLESNWQHTLKLKASDSWILPNVGFRYQWQTLDRSARIPQVNTGGQRLSFTTGAQWNFNDHKLSIKLDFPIYQLMNNEGVRIGNSYALQYIIQL